MHWCLCRQLGANTSAKGGRGAEVTEPQQDADSCREDDASALHLASCIHEQHEVADCGTFTAYEDGSVHVTFCDRTLLYLKPLQQYCDVITPDGHRVSVATATPIGVEQYVGQAMEYADWAFSTPAERAAVLQKAASIQKELGKCHRAVVLCDWTQGHLPCTQSGSFDSSDTTENAFPCDIQCCTPTVCSKEVSGVCPSSSEREQLIQALLAKSSHLLSTLS